MKSWMFPGSQRLTPPVSLTLTVLVSLTSGFQPQPPAVPLTSRDLQLEDTNRERYQRATDVLKALEISKGDWVADVGAGNGYYAQRMADLVGPAGKVFAEDIADHSIGWLHQRVKEYDLRNVEVVKGDLGDPALPANSLAGVLVVNTYHHFQQYEPMLEQIFRALKPGGRLVIADYSLLSHRTESRPDQIKQHEIDSGLVRVEVGRVPVFEFRNAKTRSSSGYRRSRPRTISVRPTCG